MFEQWIVKFRTKGFVVKASVRLIKFLESRLDFIFHLKICSTTKY